MEIITLHIYIANVIKSYHINKRFNNLNNQVENFRKLVRT